MVAKSITERYEKHKRNVSLPRPTIKTTIPNAQGGQGRAIARAESIILDNPSAKNILPTEVESETITHHQRVKHVTHSF